MLECVDVSHFYGPIRALDQVSISAAEGEFLTILGESGSGKTTMLRIISGLERPSSAARVAIAGEDVADQPAAMRNCTTVFQNYALFPHMTVEENVCYGLKVRGIAREEALKQGRRALEIVRLSGKEQRRINALSGGERQRVALARALVTKPAILLLDEPLGALDEKLRFEMQTELVEIQRSLGMTFVYITHSQEEALTMSDRVILMRKGKIEQSGVPQGLFDRPVSRFVAEFMGFENILPAIVVRQVQDRVVVRVDSQEVQGIWTAPTAPVPDARVFVAARAERMQPGVLGSQSQSPSARRNVLACARQGRTYRGKYVDIAADSAAGQIKIRVWDRAATDQAFDAVSWDSGDCVILPAE